MHDETTSTGSRRSDGEVLAQALEERANTMERLARSGERELRSMREKEAALDRAAAAFIRATMEAVEPFAQAYDSANRQLAIGNDIAHWRITGLVGEYFDEITLGKLRRLASITGGSDER